MTALRCVIDMTIRLGGANCKGALSYLGRWGRFRARRSETGLRPVSLYPRRLVIPAKAGTYWEGRSRAKREPTHSPDYGYEIPAYAGMTVMGRYRGEWIPAYAGMTAMGARCASRLQYPLPAAFAASSPLIGDLCIAQFQPAIPLQFLLMLGVNRGAPALW